MMYFLKELNWIVFIELMVERGLILGEVYDFKVFCLGCLVGSVGLFFILEDFIVFMKVMMEEYE